MQNEQQQQPSDKLSLQAMVTIIYLVCMCHSKCITVLTRSRFGINGIGATGALALAGLILLYGFTGDVLVLLYALLWFVMLIWHRFVTLIRWARGERWHSRYNGYPWLALRVPFVKVEHTAKMLIEPLGCVVLGSLLMGVSPPLGYLLLSGCVSLVVVHGVDRIVEVEKVQAMHDAEIEMRWRAHWFRNGMK